MAEVKKTFLVPLDIKQSSNDEIFTIVEGDNGNVLVVTLTDDGEPVHLTDCLVVAVFAKPNGTTVEQDSDGHGITVDAENDNVFTIDLYTTSFMQGNISCEIQVLSGDEYEVLVTSAKFNFTCRRSIMNADTIQATDEYPILVGLIDQVQEVVDGALPVHADRHAIGGTDPITPASIGAAVMASATGILDKDDWTGEDAPYSQDIDVSGITETNNVIVSPAPASADAWGEAGVRCVSQETGTLTFQCKSIPEDDLTANILIVG